MMMSSLNQFYDILIHQIGLYFYQFHQVSSSSIHSNRNISRESWTHRQTGRLTDTHTGTQTQTDKAWKSLSLPDGDD